MKMDNAAITRLVKQWCQGDTGARDALFPLIYERLRQLAYSQSGRAPAVQTLQPTALLNEAFIKLDQSGWQVESRHHFFALVARVMRQVLVDHARATWREKRGGDLLRVTLSDEVVSSASVDVNIIALDESLQQLETFNPRSARALELTYFGGLDSTSVAGELNVSRRTIERELRFGRAWLKSQLQVT